MLALDALFNRLLARSIVRASFGIIDAATASERIRRAEGIGPRRSAQLFAVIAFVGAAVVGALTGGHSIARAALALAFAGAGSAVALLTEDFRGKAVTLAAAAGCVAAIS